MLHLLVISSNIARGQDFNVVDNLFVSLLAHFSCHAKYDARRREGKRTTEQIDVDVCK